MHVYGILNVNELKFEAIEGQHAYESRFGSWEIVRNYLTRIPNPRAYYERQHAYKF